MNMDDQELLGLIHSKEQAIKENLLKTDEAKAIQKVLIDFLDEHLSEKSITGLKYRKLKTDRRLNSWWSGIEGYPIDDTWNGRFEPLIKIFDQYQKEKTIKKRLEIEGLFIESRRQGEDGDEHLLIGKKDGSGEKAHIIIDSQTGEIRVEENRIEPTELTRRVETILTLEGGKKVKTTREGFELVGEDAGTERSQQSIRDVLGIEVSKRKIEFDSTLKPGGGPADNVFIHVPVKIKNLSNGEIALRSLSPRLQMPDGYSAGLYSHDQSQVNIDLKAGAFSLQTFHFFAEIIKGPTRAANSQNTVWENNRKNILSNLSASNVVFGLRGECTWLEDSAPIDQTFDISDIIIHQLSLE
jgi:hypothetical protein